MSSVTVGVVGLGRWGPSLARVFAELPQATLRSVCDIDREALDEVCSRYPGVQSATEFQALLGDDDLDAIVLATPSSTHYELGLAALRAGKHLLVETPLALESECADELVFEARRRGRCLMVGHTLLFHPAVRKLHELVETGLLGHVYYLHGERQEFGVGRRRDSLLWSLGAHYVAVLLYLLDDEPAEVSVRGDSYLQPGVHDVLFCHLRFATGVNAYLRLSWLEPHPTRRLAVVGSRRTAVIDEFEPERKLSIYQRPVLQQSFGLMANGAVPAGDLVCPELPSDEPLRLECEHFASIVRDGTLMAGNAPAGAAVVHVLEALQRSLEADGAAVAPSGTAAALRPTFSLLRTVEEPSEPQGGVEARF